MEIEVGEYVRTPEQGFIGKLVEINKDVLNYYKIDVGREIRRTNGMSDNYIYSRDEFGLKHSKDIIDLIQEGDYINGLKVINEIYGEDDNNTYFELAVESNKTQYIGGKNIKSIVTKEQFSQMEYKLEE